MQDQALNNTIWSVRAHHTLFKFITHGTIKVQGHAYIDALTFSLTKDVGQIHGLGKHLHVPSSVLVQCLRKYWLMDLVHYNPPLEGYSLLGPTQGRTPCEACPACRV